MKINFTFSKNRADGIVKFKIRLTNLCQVFAYIWRTVTFNMPVSFISIGHLVVDVEFLAMWWRLISRFRKIEQIVIAKFKIILTNPCQFFAHTWTTATFNMLVSFISIGFLVADLGMKINFTFPKNRADGYSKIQNNTYQSMSIFCIYMENSYL